MPRYAFFLWFVSLMFAAWIALACGSRQIQSITLSPASADAQDYPDGKVAFVATGYYNSPPTVVTPLQANWGAAAERLVNGVEIFTPQDGAVTVDTNGVAQCAAGATGTFAVGAWIDLVVFGNPPCASFAFGPASCRTVLGTANLTCP